METEKLTRYQCERMILAKLKEIDNIQKRYNPGADYLSLVIWSKDKHYGGWNKYFSDDKDVPLDFYEIEMEKEEEDNVEG